ncbi:hypothetical protein ACRALDRAFT_212448 [Sodiomyces alcalophilus JCM 7366]|uniref:uncharacterized protein n=1 Tax=Sodiomyces alcalophilus JCM 7366 TaxID=591952 RepID=UPI0039B5476A
MNRSSLKLVASGIDASPPSKLDPQQTMYIPSGQSDFCDSSTYLTVGSHVLPRPNGEVGFHNMKALELKRFICSRDVQQIISRQTRELNTSF